MDGLRVEVNPTLDATGIDALVRIWTEVTNGGGAVGLVAPTTAEDARALADKTLTRVSQGLEDLVVAFEDVDGVTTAEGSAEPIAFGFLARNHAAIDGHWATVTRLQRDPRRHGSGAGAAVLQALEDHARSLGLEFVQLAVRGGTGRERFYAAHGYQLVAVLPRWLRIGPETRDSLILVKALGSAAGSWALTPQATATAAVVGAAGGLRVAVQRLDPELPLPRYAHPGDAGLDLQAREDATLGPGERRLMPTGFAVAIPPGFVGLVHPRSGLALRHGLSLANAPGTIDAGYRGELKLPLVNLDPEAPVTIHRGDRIAQLLVQPVAHVTLDEVDHLPPATRDTGGFGSTGE